MAWFLKAHLYQHTKGLDKSNEIDYGNVASVFDPRCLILVLRVMRDAADHKNWTELHAAMECFEELVRFSTTILIVVKSCANYVCKFIRGV
jgi:hypothetical protein